MVSNEIEFKYSNKNLKIHKNTSLLDKKKGTEPLNLQEWD